MQLTSTSLVSVCSLASVAPLSPAAVAVGLGVNDGDDLGEWRAAGGYCDGLDSASHRHTITCVHDSNKSIHKWINSQSDSQNIWSEV